MNEVPMKKLSLICLSASILAITSLDAAVYKGQREYVKKCRKCHGDGQKLMASKEIADWRALMKNKGQVLAELHLDTKEAKKSWKYFQGKKFKKKARHLEDFMEEYASDSGNVPACN